MSKKTSAKRPAKKPVTRPSYGETRAPQGREEASAEVAEQLEAAPNEQRDDDKRHAYPLFPDLSRGDVHAVAVYRKTQKPSGKGQDWQRIAFPWDAAQLSWDQIADVCGGGSYAVLAKGRDGKTVGSVQTSAPFDGPARSPTQADVFRVAPGLSREPVTETANGWVAVPGADPALQAAFLAYQQVAHYARTDATQAHASMAALLGSLAEQIQKPDPGLAVLQQLVESQRMTLERMASELKTAHAEITLLKVANVSSGNAADAAKAALLNKGVDVIDGIAGAIAKRMLEAGPAAEASPLVPPSNGAV
jgi:hypothetical protein